MLKKCEKKFTGTFYVFHVWKKICFFKMKLRLIFVCFYKTHFDHKGLKCRTTPALNKMRSIHVLPGEF